MGNAARPGIPGGGADAGGLWGGKGGFFTGSASTPATVTPTDYGGGPTTSTTAVPASTTTAGTTTTWPAAAKPAVWQILQGWDGRQAQGVRSAVRRDGAEGHALEATVTVPQVSGAPTPQMLEGYNWCISRAGAFPERGTPDFARAARAEPHEIMKQRDRYLVVVPAAWEGPAVPAPADMAICLPNLETSLACPCRSTASRCCGGSPNPRATRSSPPGLRSPHHPGVVPVL